MRLEHKEVGITHITASSDSSLFQLAIIEAKVQPTESERIESRVKVVDAESDSGGVLSETRRNHVRRQPTKLAKGLCGISSKGPRQSPQFVSTRLNAQIGAPRQVLAFLYPIRRRRILFMKNNTRIVPL